MTWSTEADRQTDRHQNLFMAGHGQVISRINKGSQIKLSLYEPRLLSSDVQVFFYYIKVQHIFNSNQQIQSHQNTKVLYIP